MRALYICLFLWLSILPGCSTKSSVEVVKNDAVFSPSATFSSVETFDKSGYTPKGGNDEIVLTKVMQAALNSALTKAQIFGDDYQLKTTILAYEPGNAFARWLIPGAGATKLHVVCEVFSKDDVLIAKLPVDRLIAAGGGYTIGAWKYVFDDVAQEIVKLIKKQLLPDNQ